MIRIYTSLKYFESREIIIDNEAFFKNISTSDLSPEYLALMKTIDKAEFLDVKTGKIETPYGIGNIWDLSTGCKTALNILYLYTCNKFPTVKAINITECGVNALEEIFNTVEDHNIKLDLVLEHDDSTFKCKERNYLINGKYNVNQLAFIGAYR